MRITQEKLAELLPALREAVAHSEREEAAAKCAGAQAGAKVSDPR